MLNINVPDLPEEEIAGMIVTKQGKSKLDDIYEKRIDPYGKDYYWLTGKMYELDSEIDFDQAAVKQNYISVTPIHFDLTDFETFDEMKKWEIEKSYDEKRK